jgi:hypothetical protein
MDIITLGDYGLLLPDDPDLFVYTRRYGKEELLVVCNFSKQERSLTLPEHFCGALLLVSNEETRGAGSGAYGAAVYSACGFNTQELAFAREL